MPTPADALARHPAFAGLSSTALAEVAARCEPMWLRPGGVLFEEGAPSVNLFVVLEGWLRVSCRAASGVQVVVGSAQGGGCRG